jgi:hypothetical protein
MAHLTNGAIYYERRMKTGDWEHKFAHQTINYAFEEDDTEERIDELLARARTLVVHHVHQAIRGNKEAVAKVGPDPVDSNGAPAVPVAIDPGLCPDPVVDPVVVVSDELNRGFIVPGSFTKPDEDLLPRTSLKEAMANFIPMAPNLKAAKRAAKKRPVEVITDVVETPLVIEEAIVEDFTAVAPEPTDVDLSQALSRINAKLKDRPKIQALIGEFVQSGQSYVMIPAVRRTEFVTRLEALV